MKIKAISVALLSLLCSGCISSSAPANDRDFSQTLNLQMLEGCYQNAGIGEGDTHSTFLSAAIWPAAKIDHASIKSIRVTRVDDRSLKVSAEREGRVVHESRFSEGNDFEFSSGRIKLKSSPLVSLAYPAGNPFIGAGYESQEIGIDTSGDGKLLNTGAFAGTGFLVIPVAGHFQNAYRFPKDPALCDNQ